MPGDLKPIETRYRGYRFRSRLEARWAVFFDHAGVKWEYEPEGFQTPFGWYLPDFRLPDIDPGWWIEVKPNCKAQDDRDLTYLKLGAVARGSQMLGMVVCGDPMDAVSVMPMDAPGAADWSAYAVCGGTWAPDPQFAGEDPHEIYRAWDAPFAFCVCTDCLSVGIEFDGRGDRVCKRKGCKTSDHGDKGYSYSHPKLIAAAEYARGARFA